MGILSLHKKYWSYRRFSSSALSGILLLVASLAVNSAAISYTNRQASNSVSDLLLDNLPVVDTDLFFVYGFAAFIFLAAMFLFLEPRRIPFAIKSIALLILVRSFFISLTHLGPYPGGAFGDHGEFTRKFFFSDDFFFSGHTATPFLVALVFWDNRFVRFFSIAASVLGGASAILGHLHYSIDVFGAFFITYALFDVSKRLFAKDYAILRYGLDRGAGPPRLGRRGQVQGGGF